jgi:hypothetical protein
MHMKLTIRKCLGHLAIAMASTMVAGLALAEPDAPRECTATGNGPGYDVDMSVSKSFCRDSIGDDCQSDADCPNGDVCLTEDLGLVRFAYAIDTNGLNPDHAVLSFDAVPVCAASKCSISETPCTTSAECLGTGGNENDDVCLVDSECIYAAGEDTTGYPSISNGLRDPGEGDSKTITGRYEKSRRVMTANPNQAVSRFFIDISGDVSCDDGDVVIVTGKKVSSCPLCAPLTDVALADGSFANTEKTVEVGHCRFKRRFTATGQLIDTEVMVNDPSEPPCEGIVISTDANGELMAKGAGQGPVGPMPFSNFSNVVGNGPNNPPEDFGFNQQSEGGGIEYTSGSGTCVTLSDGFGGTSLSCTCQKPLSRGELTYCR